MKKITSDLLRRRGACMQQIYLFIELGGDRLALTEELCIKHANQFAWDWAADNLLTRKARTYYKRIIEPALAKYEHAVQAAAAEYENTLQKALAKDVPTVEVEAWGEVDALVEYRRVQKPAWAQYKRACASAFYRAWTMHRSEVAEIVA